MAEVPVCARGMHHAKEANQEMNKLSRRGFLKASGGGVAAGAAVTVGAVVASPEAGAVGGTLPAYEKKMVGHAGKLAVGQPVTFAYPDDTSPCTLVKIGNAVPGGVGPDGDIVAYSSLCTHMGCPVVYDGGSATFRCPCHFSTFDAELSGQMICGQATENLPQIVLEHDSADDSVSAVAVDGLIYGRVSNIL